MNAPTIILPANPAGLDKAVNELISKLSSVKINVTGTEDDFFNDGLVLPLAQRDAKTGAPVVYWTKKDYWPARHSDSFRSTMFFTSDGDSTVQSLSYEKFNVSFIVVFNQERYAKDLGFQIKESVINEFITILKKSIPYENRSTVRVVRAADQVFDGFDVEHHEILKHPYQGFRISMEYTVDGRCGISEAGSKFVMKPLSQYTNQELQSQLSAAQRSAVKYSSEAEQVFSALNITDETVKAIVDEFISTCGWAGIKDIIIPAIHNTKGLKGIVTPTLNGVAGGLKGYQFSGAQYVNSNYNPVAQGDTENNFAIGALTNYAKSKAAGSDLYSMLTGVYNFGGNPSAGVGFYENNTAFSSVGGGAPLNVAQAEFDRLGFYTKTDEDNVYFYLNDQLVDTVPLKGNGLPNTTLPIGAGKFDVFGIGNYSIMSHFTGNIAVWFVGNSNFDPAVFDPAAKKLLEFLSTVSIKTPEELYSELVKDQLSYINEQAIQRVYNYNHITGQVTEYATGDDVWIKNNVFNDIPTSGKLVALVDFFTLAENNVFGNTNRFTDDQGTQAYANNQMVDHYTGLVWLLTPQGPTTFISSLFTASNAGWFVANIRQMDSLVNKGSNKAFNYGPVNNFGLGINTRLWTSTTVPENTALAYAITNGVSGFYGMPSIVGKTDNYHYLYCKRFSS